MHIKRCMAFHTHAHEICTYGYFRHGYFGNKFFVEKWVRSEKPMVRSKSHLEGSKQIGWPK